MVDASLPIVLGSSSKFRRRILQSHFPLSEIQCISPDIDEKAIGGKRDEPIALSLDIALAKAKALLPRLTQPCLLITSDQIAVCNSKIREKPNDAQEAREYLVSYATYPVETFTAVVVTNTQTGHQYQGVDRATQHFLPIPEEIITQVVEKGETMHCSGGFMIDEPLLMPYLGQRDGDEDSIIGMPLRLTKQLMAQATDSI